MDRAEEQRDPSRAARPPGKGAGEAVPSGTHQPGGCYLPNGRTAKGRGHTAARSDKCSSFGRRKSQQHNPAPHPTNDQIKGIFSRNNNTRQQYQDAETLSRVRIKALKVTTKRMGKSYSSV